MLCLTSPKLRPAHVFCIAAHSLNLIPSVDFSRCPRYALPQAFARFDWIFATSFLPLRAGICK